MQRFASLVTIVYVAASLCFRVADAAPEPTSQALNPYGEIDPPQLRVMLHLCIGQALLQIRRPIHYGPHHRYSRVLT